MSAADRRDVIEQAATAVFAQRGYRGASVAEIARESGVTVPVVYDHFRSKQELYERLLIRHYAELRDVWFTHAAGGAPLTAWLPAAVDAWFEYVERHPFAGRMLFADSTGDPHLQAIHREIQRASRDQMLPLVVEATEGVIDGSDPIEVELVWEPLRAVLQGLAVWWVEHPDVERSRVVTAALDAVWAGLGRLQSAGRPRRAGRRDGRKR